MWLFTLGRQLTWLQAQQETIMAQLDDLKALLADVGRQVDAVGVEVADLIAKLSTVPPPTDLTEVIGLAQGIADKLKAIPPEPV